jgi:hypothetical protein
MAGHLLFGHNDGHYADIYMDIMFFVYKGEQNYQK